MKHTKKACFVLVLAAINSLGNYHEMETVYSYQKIGNAGNARRKSSHFMVMLGGPFCPYLSFLKMFQDLYWLKTFTKSWQSLSSMLMIFRNKSDRREKKVLVRVCFYKLNHYPLVVAVDQWQLTNPGLTALEYTRGQPKTLS